MSTKNGQKIGLFDSSEFFPETRAAVTMKTPLAAELRRKIVFPAKKLQKWLFLTHELRDWRENRKDAFRIQKNKLQFSGPLETRECSEISEKS